MPKRKGVQQGKGSAGSAQASDASRDSGVSQPADNEGARILVVDAGCIKAPCVLAQQFVKDERNALCVNDILETTELLNAGIIIGIDLPQETPPETCHMQSQCLRNKMTSWHVWYDMVEWTVQSFKLRYLSEDFSLAFRQCAILDLLNRNDGTEMHVMVMKNFTGNKAAPDYLQLDTIKRHEIMEFVFQFLYGHENPGIYMVLGDLGVGLSTLHSYMQAHDIDDSVQTHCNKSQTCHALLRAPPHLYPWLHTSTIDTGSERMMLHQTSTHCAEALVLKTSRTCQVEALVKLTAGCAASLIDNDDAHLIVQLIYQPFINKRQHSDGHLHNDPIDVQESADTFANALKLIKMMRIKVGCEKDGQTLSSAQFGTAYGLLKDLFKTKFMTNKTLLATDPDTLSGKKKKKYKEDEKGAFKSWARGLLGHHAFLLAVLRHGLFDFSDLKQYASLLAAERKQDDGGKPSGGGPHPARNEALRRKALKARQHLREAKKWREWEDAGWQLYYWQVQQVKFLETGKLWKEMIEANVAYGHGVGADIGLSKEQAATLEIYTQGPMSKYWTT